LKVDLIVFVIEEKVQFKEVHLPCVGPEGSLREWTGAECYAENVCRQWKSAVWRSKHSAGSTQDKDQKTFVFLKWFVILFVV